MSRLKPGDRVRWVGPLSDPQKQIVEGAIVAVIPSDSGLETFTMYDVQFTFGHFTLYGNQLEPK